MLPNHSAGAQHNFTVFFHRHIALFTHILHTISVDEIKNPNWLLRVLILHFNQAAFIAQNKTTVAIG